MKKQILTLFVCSLFSIAYSQTQEATTTEGKKIVLNNDGTWKYKEEPTLIETAKPTGNCIYKTNEVDEFTKSKKLVLKEEDFIKYTSEELKKYYKNRDYLTCQVYCAQVSELKVVYLYWKILSKETYKTYGSIEKGTKFMVKLKNEQMIELLFSEYDSGDTNYDYGYTTFSSYIILNDEQFESLQSSEIDKIRMYWSKGYEDYPVVNSSVFINQLPCVK